MPEEESVGFALFNNMQTQTTALGVAADLEDGYIYYASTAGPSVSVKSIWATLCDNSKKSRVYVEPWFNAGTSFDGPAGIGVAYADIKGSTYKHMACRWKGEELLLVTDKRGLQHPNRDIHAVARKAIRREYLPQVLYSFTEYINAETSVPALPQWSRALWRAGYENKAIRELHTYGDCVGAWLLERHYDWLALTQELIAAGEIVFDYELLEEESQ